LPCSGDAAIRSIILLRVRWDCKYGISYRDFPEMM
jgi:transposase-like protein